MNATKEELLSYCKGQGHNPKFIIGVSMVSSSNMYMYSRDLSCALSNEGGEFYFVLEVYKVLPSYELIRIY